MVCIQHGNNYYISYWLIVKLHSLIYNEYQDLGNAIPSILYSIKVNDTLRRVQHYCGLILAWFEKIHLSIFSSCFFLLLFLLFF